ncbi:MAG: heat-shock protein [Bacteroidetes bacterium GWF2_38_335]|nr:MAG: heat-shock protein [Bacteroidetes bacterium GWF2_38_335]OFY80919.1 MAG: heat-shock protein [Bacteroidetes bacterium RIFOXYA12_FULL_38_20]HBS84944.1 heat-shock protein [Bacteroidales bacterium]
MTIVKRTNNVLPTFFDDFFTDSFFNTPVYRRFSNQAPAVNIRESENDFQIEVAAPGFGKDDFKVEFENNRLTISSKNEINNEEQDDSKGFIRREFSYQSFERSFTVDEKSIDSEKIQAKYENGILTLSLPKREELKPKPARMIQIS